jgi:hypothetical protein
LSDWRAYALVRIARLLISTGTNLNELLARASHLAASCCLC